MIRVGRASVFIMGMAALAFAALQTGCTGSGKNAPPGASGPNPFQPQRQTVYSVTTTEVREQRMEDYVKLNGDVVPETSVSVYPDIAGTVSP
jgi:uncharacterized protein YdeI (BOF family)